MRTDRENPVVAPARRVAGLAACVVLGLTACKGAGDERSRAAPAPAASASGDVVLARFGDRTLTVRELEEHLAFQPPLVREQYATKEAREKLVGEMVRLEVLLDEAKRRGFDRSPKLQVVISELIVEEMMTTLFGSEEAEASRVTDEEIRHYYDAHTAEFRPPDRPAMARSMEDVQVLIRARIAQAKRREAMEKFANDLLARARVHVEREAISTARP